MNPKVKTRSSFLRNDLVAVTQNLVKVMNQSSYYEADHPAAKAITDEPFRLLKGLKGRILEVSYGLWGGVENDQLALEGVLGKSLLLAELLGAQNPYLLKLIDYFQRNQIVSLAIKPTIGEDEFNRFIYVFVQQNRSHAADDNGAALATLLKAEKIVHVSLLVWSDLVGGRDLAWPVRIVLSRLCKDITVLPLFAEALDTDIAHAKRLLVGDMVRPLRRADLVKELLMNIDIVSNTVESWSETEVEEAVVACLNVAMKDAVCWELVDEIVGRSGVINPGSAATRALRRLYVSLAQENDPDTFKLFRRLLELELIRFEGLPSGLQQEIKIESWTNEFEDDAESFFGDFDSPPSPARYHELLKLLVAIVPELLRRKHPEGAFQVLNRIYAHAKAAGDNAKLRKLLLQTIKMLRSEENNALALALISTTSEANRKPLRQLFPLMGPEAARGVLELLRNTDGEVLQRECVLILKQMGKVATDDVVAALSEASLPWAFQKSLCTALAGQHSEAAVRALIACSKDEHSEVRAEALNALAQAKTDRANERLIEALGDPEAHIQRRVLGLLDDMNCTDPRLVVFICDTLALRKKGSDEPPTALQLAAIRKGQDLCKESETMRASLETAFIAAIQPSRAIAVIRKLKGEHVEKTESIRAAACRALLQGGSKASIDALNHALNDKSERVRAAAEETLEALYAKHKQ
jgi:HEAT repeat protein